MYAAKGVGLVLGGTLVAGAGLIFATALMGNSDGGLGICVPSSNPTSMVSNLPSGPAPPTTKNYSSDQQVLFMSIKTQTNGNARVALPMIMGSYLESGWKKTYSPNGGAGYFQIQLSAHPEVTLAEAQDPVLATRFMLRRYEIAVPSIPDNAWTQAPLYDAPEQVAKTAENPTGSYYESQGVARVAEAYQAAITAMRFFGISTDIGSPEFSLNTGVAAIDNVPLPGTAPSGTCVDGTSSTSDQGVILVSGIPAAKQRQTVITAAKSLLGVPYSFAGGNKDGPTYGICTNDAGFNDCHVRGIDCSGLTLFAYNKIGLVLPHYAATQWHMMQSFTVVAKGESLSQAQPGDIIFFTGSDGSVADPGHVGIYLGGGKMIQAPQSGEVVKISDITTPFWQSEFVGVADPYAYLASLQKSS